MLKKTIFILKRREDFNPKNHYTKSLSTGLYNSASFVNEMLVQNGIDSSIEVAQDNNSIDKILTDTKANICILEALWVVPTKLRELEDLHPNVKFIIRLHSETPFIANEGIATQWINDYLKLDNIILAPNSPRFMEELIGVYGYPKKFIYLPNYYPVNFEKRNKNNSDEIHISCFGAIRPLKNHLIQAFSAIIFANKINKKLRFHINVGRVEGGADPIQKNLLKLFEGLLDSDHRLIMHEWMDHKKFKEVSSEMDIAMQVSFSETFNIVGADQLSNGVPVVGSYGEIPWSCELFNANPVEYKSIVNKLNVAYKLKKLNVLLNQFTLKRYVKKSKKLWLEYLK